MKQESFELVYSPEVRKQIEELADIYSQPLTTDMVKQDYSILREAEVIFSGWGGPKLDKKFLDFSPNLKTIFYAAGTVKQIVTDESWRRNISITNAVNANAIPVAEFTLSQILFCLKNGWQIVRKVQSDQKYPSKPMNITGAYGRIVGLISLSTVGRRVCELLKPFDIQVIAYDPFIQKEEAAKLGAKLCSLEEVFRNSDIVSVHTPLLEETKGMIKGEHFTMMKPESSFINTARGAIVNEKEMIGVLRDRSDITTVLDVTFPEPPEQGSPLYTLSNVVLTPHIAGSEGAECGRMGLYMLEEFKRYINGDRLMWEVKRENVNVLA